MSKRTRYSAEFKAKVVIGVIQEEETLAQLLSRLGVHSTQISARKRQALAGLSGVFLARQNRNRPMKRKARNYTQKSVKQLWGTE